MCKSSKKPRRGMLEEMTIEEVRDLKPEVVVIPIGSTEPHGPYLPYCCDTMHARETAERATVIANSHNVSVLCYPTIPISLNVNFSGFPFALTLRVRTFMDVLRDVCEQIEREGVRKIVILNGHWGNTDCIGAFLREWASKDIAGTYSVKEHAFVCAVIWPLPKARKIIENPSEHSGETEILDVMAHYPEFVRKDKLEDIGSTKPKLKALDCDEVMWVKPWHMHMPESAAGKIGQLTQEKANEFARVNAESLAELLVELGKEPWTDKFPY